MEGTAGELAFRRLPRREPALDSSATAMKYAILADIHANLQALEAVLEDMKKQGCTRAVCLGDIVGYNANPKECLDIIRGMNIPCVKGNHDQYVDGDEPLGDFNPYAAKAVEWTRQQLTNEDRRWLSDLPLTQTVAGFTIVHATLDAPARWGYVFDNLAAAAHFHYQSTPVCFFGHTHVPVAFVKDSVVRGGTCSKLKVEQGKQYFINPGSVGQPRDGNPKAAYAIYDMNAATVEMRRVEYDVPGAQGAIERSGLPKTPSGSGQQKHKG